MTKIDFRVTFVTCQFCLVKYQFTMHLKVCSLRLSFRNTFRGIVGITFCVFVVMESTVLGNTVPWLEYRTCSVKADIQHTVQCFITETEVVLLPLPMFLTGCAHGLYPNVEVLRQTLCLCTDAYLCCGGFIRTGMTPPCPCQKLQGTCTEPA